MAIALAGTSSDGNNIAGASSSTAATAAASAAAAAAGGAEEKKEPSATATKEPVSGPQTAVEMLGGCSVCLDDQGTEENPLVYCDGCELAVHQACYGIVRVPSGNWFCRRCEYGDPQAKIKCELCPSKEGALKKTEVGQWAHVVCALYIPEVRFGNNNTMEPIIIKHIQPDRYSKKCYLCEENNNPDKAIEGAVMDCHKQNCKQSFHVTCAQSAGLLCEEAGQGSDNLVYCGYCKHHFRKLKAGSRKSGGSNSTLNNSSSSYLDSASDSSQDNDSRCNTQTKEHLDKSRANKLPTIQPTNLSTNDVPATTSNNSSATTNITSSATATTTTTNSKQNSSSPNYPPISLTLTLNSAFSNSNTPAASVASPQKKRRAPKSSTSTTSNSTTLLATTGTSSSNNQDQQQQLATAPNSVPNINLAAQDVYNWTDKDPMTNNNNNNNNNLSNNNNKSSKKKPMTSSTQISSSTKSSTALTTNNYSPQKVGSPNLSLSTSSTLTSPANSTKSASSSSTTTTTTSSSSSTTSNSPSPSLLSPNISNRGSTVRQESPLASNSKTGNIPQSNRAAAIPESVASNITLPFGQANLQTRINLEDPKKSATSSSSLLSTAVPIPLEPEPVPSSSTRNFTGTDGSIPPTKLNPNTTSSSTTGNLHFNAGTSGDHTKSTISDTTNSSHNNNTQPTVPPLIIPVPQLAPELSSSKQQAKSKSSSKSSSRKKSTESNDSLKSEPLKPKPSRSKKAVVNTNTTTTNNNNNIVSSAPQSETKRSKSKASTSKQQANVTTSSATSGGGGGGDSATKSQAITTPTPSKRKSRSSSNTTEPSVAAPSPAKRSRKKKTDQTTSSSSPEKLPSASGGSNQPPPPNVINQSPFPSSTANGPIGTGPLMINTPMVNNRLMQGVSSLESQDMGNRFGFSPMISPYANFDHLNAPALSRSSLSRMFTTSLTDPSYQPNMAEDPGKAFDELRENTWSHLSKCVLDQAQQFDIPSLIGTLYTLRSENEKLVNKVRDLSMKRDQLLAMSARLDLPGPMLTQHLNNTSPNFSSLVSGLTNSPKSLPAPSPGSGINKQPLVSVGPYNHLPPGSLGPPGYVDRSSPLVGQTHSGLNNIKSSSVSTPSPPIGALMAHSGTGNRAGLITVNPPYMPSVYPPMNPMNSIGPNPQGSSYFPRQ